MNIINFWGYSLDPELCDYNLKIGFLVINWVYIFYLSVLIYHLPDTKVFSIPVHEL